MGPSFIRKYTLATQQVTDFAKVGGVEFMHSDGAHVVWTDAPAKGAGLTTVWSNTPDGSHPVALGAERIVNQLAMDGSSAYWVASAIGGDYTDIAHGDIVTASLNGGPTRKIACRVAVQALAVDETDVYFLGLADGAPGKMIGKIPKIAR